MRSNRTNLQQKRKNRLPLEHRKHYPIPAVKRYHDNNTHLQLASQLLMFPLHQVLGFDATDNPDKGNNNWMGSSFPGCSYARRARDKMYDSSTKSTEDSGSTYNHLKYCIVQNLRSPTFTDRRSFNILQFDFHRCV